ncbi:MAG: heme exporter protein CcmD [Rubrivivax sp.]|jgi:heme exporter protein D|nr:heme exporter protein CcmD [Rubrivivax sp.]
MTAQWSSAAEFFHMSGYGFYVWGSYGVALVVMLAEPLLARRRHQQALLQAGRMSDDEPLDKEQA